MTKAGGRLGKEQLELIDVIRRRAHDVKDLGNAVAGAHADEILAAADDIYDLHREAHVGHGYDAQVYDRILKAMAAIRKDASLDRDARKAALRELDALRKYVMGRRRK